MYVYNVVVVKKFTFAISSPVEFVVATIYRTFKSLSKFSYKFKEQQYEMTKFTLKATLLKCPPIFVENRHIRLSGKTVSSGTSVVPIFKFWILTHGVC